jgi:serine/threonine protein kinase/Tfp pilus assembly protein PilF
MEAAKEELSTGSTFASRYQIIEELGKGGMGKVYKAHDTKIKEKIALKLINPEIAKDEKTIERFRNELRLARKIRHKNICQMFDLGEDKGTHFITMEFVQGEDLKSMIKMSGRLAVETTLHIARQLCAGLTEAHKSGVVHRDLKPSNIMIDRKGNVSIMDFGIARSLEAKGITGAGIMIGTPEFMSPEQVEGKEVDPRSDIYSLGVILYEMVTGRAPFEGDTAYIIGMKQKTETPKAPKEINAQIPEALNRLILRCLEKKKEKRYQTAEEILSELIQIDRDKQKKDTAIEMEIKNSIAVLPFTDLSPQKDQEYFCDGMAEELINTLTKIEGIKVVSRTSSFQFKGVGYDICEIGKKLKVQTVLEGSVRKAGDRLRITAQLVNVADGYHLWSEKYDREMEDIFAVQDEISLAIVDKLKIELFGKEKAKLVKRHTDNPEAYSLYLKGRYFWNMRTVEGAKRSTEYFEKAIEKDSDYAMAYVGLADSYLILPYYGSFRTKDCIPKARESAIKALEIDNSIAEAHTTLAMLIMYDERDWENAEEKMKIALNLNPNYATAHLWYAWLHLWNSRFDKAIQEFKKAQESDPLSLVINNELGLAFFYAREYDKAFEQYHKTIEIDPNFIFTYMYLGWGYLQKSMFEEALTQLKKEQDLAKGRNPYVETWIAVTYLRMGEKGKAREILAKLIKKSEKEYVSPYHIALIHFALGENDKGFDWMDIAYQEMDYWLNWIKIEPALDGVRTDPRFKALLGKLNFE